jgi:cell division transport system ATP-binding protein
MIHFFNASIKLGKSYALRNIQLEILPNEFVYLVGPSGAGKTTLLRSIYMDVFPDEGHVVVGDYSTLDMSQRDVARVRRMLGIVFQDFQLLNDRSVFDNAALTLHLDGLSRKEIRRRVLRILAEVGLSHKRHALPESLSGGEQQRLAIARAVLHQPDIILADEPTGNLDMETAEDILRLIRKFHERGAAAVIATHNQQLVEQFPGRVITLEGGRIREESTL